MNELKQIADFVGSLGPTALLGIGLYVLAKRYREKDSELAKSQEDRIKAAEAYAQEKRQDSKENTAALLAVADRVNQAIDRLEASAK